ncbi:MAG: DMT family transporter [Clostridiales Family XIII bacterium]|jgi:drug/metabolite transporter (DMT)-like permease|nr:DMT family transporter [Clostridiales Family XIII bacterium]
MTVLVFSWGYEYIAAKNVLDAIHPITLVFFKYSIAFLIMFAIKVIRTRADHARVFPVNKKDLPFYFLCAIFGEILYYVGEYGAIGYLPVSTVTILLSFVPILSIIIEWIVYKRRPGAGVIIGVAVCVVGVGFVVGGDIGQIFGRSGTGYLLAVMAIVSWNIYNFITAKLADSYTAYDLTMLQLIASAIVSMPYAVTHLPDAAAVDGGFVFSIGYLVVCGSILGFIIYVNAVGSIGVTPTTLFSNMMPVTSTFFGWLFLGELIRPIQIVGGIVVVTAGSVVIWLKGREQDKEAPHV